MKDAQQLFVEPSPLAPAGEQPYVGPRPFEETEESLFFGREREVNELGSLVVAHPLTILYAQSGAGKTSLVNAKLIPLLKRENYEVLPPARVQGIEYEDARNIYVFNALTIWTKGQLDRQQLAEVSIADFLAKQPHHTQKITSSEEWELLRFAIFDQFEELFTSYPHRWKDRRNFFEQVRDALEKDSLLRVVLAMREDYIAELDPYASILTKRMQARYRLDLLREDAAFLAITKPLEGTTRHYAEGAAELLVKKLMRIPSKNLNGEPETMGQYVEPVQLQVFCRSLWQALRPGEAMISKEEVENFDVDRALSDFYERAIQSAIQIPGVNEGGLRRWFENLLITPDGTRGIVFRGEEKTGGIPTAVADELAKLQIISSVWRGGSRWYELTHDRFIGPLRKSNEAWFSKLAGAEQIRRRFEAKATEWAARGRGNNGLLSEGELLEAERWIASPEAAELNISDKLRALVQASRAALDENAAQREVAQARALVTERQQRVRQLKVGLFAAALLLILMFVFAYSAWNQRAAAMKAEGIAQSRLLATKATSNLEISPELSVLLAKEAIDHFAHTEEAEEVMRTGLLSLSMVRGALRGHTRRVKSASFSSDGRYILTASDEGTARLWDASTQKLIKELRKETERIVYAEFSPDGKLIVTTSTDGTAQVWDGSTGDLIRELRGHRDQVSRATFSPDSRYILTASEDATARVWEASTGNLIQELPGHGAGVHDVAFSPDGIHIATEAVDTTGKIWELNSKKVITLEGLTGPMPAIAFSPDGKLLVTEGGSNTVRGLDTESDSYVATVWNVATGKKKFTLEGHQGYITAVAFSPNGRLIVTASNDGTARVWNAETNGKLVYELRGHTKPVARAAFSHDSKFIVTASADNTARVWDMNTGRSVAILRGHGDAVNSAAFSRDGRFIVTASDDMTARLWDAGRDPNRVPTLTGHLGPVNSAAFSPDGTLIVTAGFDGTARLWDASTGTFVALLGGKNGHKARVVNAAFSPDGKFIATTSFDKTARVWRVDTNQKVFEIGGFKYPMLNVLDAERVLSGHTDNVNKVAFSPDGKFIVTASKDKTARVWDMNTGKSVELRHESKVNGATFSPDGKLIVTASDDATVRIWHASTYAFIRTLGKHVKEVYSAEYSPNGELIVTASADGIARVWNARTGESVAELRGHTDEVNSAVFSPNGKFIVTSSDDKTARVWETSTWQSITPLRGHTGKVYSAAFSPDSMFIVTASADGTARLYPSQAFTPFENLSELIRQHVTRELTPEERKSFLIEPQSSH